MKKFLFVGSIFATMFFTACQLADLVSGNNNTDDEAAEAADILADEAAVDAFFFMGPGGSGGNFNGDSTCHCNDLTELSLDSIPADITAYITANYPDYVVDRAGYNSEGNYFVKIENADDTDHKLLVFDEAYAFVKECIHAGHDGNGHGGHDGNGHGGHDGNGHGGHDGDNDHSDGHHNGFDHISIDSLPAAITDYIVANYVGAEIHKAAVSENTGNFIVIIFIGTDVKALLFDPNGLFLQEL